MVTVEVIRYQIPVPGGVKGRQYSLYASAGLMKLSLFSECREINNVISIAYIFIKSP